MRRRGKVLLFSGILALLPAGAYAWYRHSFPYGATHKCDLGIAISLQEYAGKHGGNYPDEGGSAASLSLLTEYGSSIDTLAGKAIRKTDAEACFARHGKLTEEFCSWHYVPGLRSDSNPQLALFWDTTGLSHNGQRRKRPSYDVILVDGTRRSIPEREWPAFLRQQERLRQEDHGQPRGTE